MVHEEILRLIDDYEGAGRDSLIPLLQDAQEIEGYISKEIVELIGAKLNLPASKIYGVATFYNQFRFNKPGKFHIQLCRGTACHVKGSATILDTLERELKVKAGETTRDGLFSLEVVACIGACGLAPVIAINGEFYANVDNKKIRKIIKQYKNEEKKNAVAA